MTSSSSERQWHKKFLQSEKRLTDYRKHLQWLYTRDLHPDPKLMGHGVAYNSTQHIHFSWAFIFHRSQMKITNHCSTTVHVWSWVLSNQIYHMSIWMTIFFISICMHGVHNCLPQVHKKNTLVHIRPGFLSININSVTWLRSAKKSRNYPMQCYTTFAG